MQDVENNMDELFRRAAEGYPLKTSKDGWDNIVPLLNRNIIAAPAAYKDIKIKKYTALFLFLVFFLIVGGSLTKLIWNKSAKILTAQQGKTNQPVKITSVNNSIVETIAGNKGNSKKQALIFASENVKKKYLLKKNNAANAGKATYHYNINRNVSTDKETEKVATGSERVINEKILPAVIDNEKFSIKKVIVAAQLANTLPPEIPILAVPEINKKQPGETNKRTAIKSNQQPKVKGSIYRGVISGPSFNSIKTQGLKKTGYDIGVLAGYQISKSIAFETGLMYDRKYYFSSGKYFDMAKVSATMPADMKVLSLEGSCAVFEIPVKVKYNLRTKNNTNFFTTAGISNYIIINEYNKYQAALNGTQQNITSNYNNTARYLAAALNVSVGYESKIGSSVSMRIEPYVQIPLRGIGVGSLPVMTAGLHIGFTSPFH